MGNEALNWDGLMKNTSVKTFRIRKIDLSYGTTIFAYQQVSRTSPAKREDNYKRGTVKRFTFSFK